MSDIWLSHYKALLQGSMMFELLLAGADPLLPTQRFQASISGLEQR